MSTEPGGTEPGGTPPPEDDLSGLSEQELREAYEAELARIRVEDVLVQTVVSLLNLAARKAGLTGADEEPDYDQVGQAIDATRALLPFVEPTLGAETKQVRDALTQLQLAYTQSGAGGGPAPAGEAAAPAAEPGESASAPSSGRLWIPGQ
jgi:hypothetical protein